MSESAALEERYRRLLAWYPRSFRREQEAEMLAVLMAGARPGQRRPGLLETADLLRSALGMRLVLAMRSPGPGLPTRRWTDALALFSVVAPLFLVVVAVLQVAVPYQVPPGSLPFAVLGGHEIGGLSLLRVPFFDVAVCLQIVVAVFALIGWRRLTLIAMAASVLYWIVYWRVGGFGIPSVPDALQLLTAGAYLLGAAALLASPGPGHGRHLMNWRHWAVLLPAAAFVQVTTLLLYATSPVVGFSGLRSPDFSGLRSPDTSGYLVLSVVFAAATVVLAVALKLNRYFLLFLTATFYPYAMQLAFSGAFRPGFGTDLLRLPTPAHLALLFVPPVLLACWVALTAIRPPRSHVTMSPGQEA
jgi:hypothetical protein